MVFLRYELASLAAVKHIFPATDHTSGRYVHPIEEAKLVNRSTIYRLMKAEMPTFMQNRKIRKALHPICQCCIIEQDGVLPNGYAFDGLILTVEYTDILVVEYRRTPDGRFAFLVVDVLRLDGRSEIGLRKVLRLQLAGFFQIFATFVFGEQRLGIIVDIGIVDNGRSVFCPLTAIKIDHSCSSFIFSRIKRFQSSSPMTPEFVSRRARRAYAPDVVYIIVSSISSGILRVSLADRS